MWPDRSQTHELLLKAQDGDNDAVNRLFERHREALRRVVEARLDRAIQPRVDASDIVQDVLIEANRRLPGYLTGAAAGKMPFRLWLRQIARDGVIDAYRRHRVAGRRSMDREQRIDAPAHDDSSAMNLAGRLVDRELTPATAATRRELETRFQAAIGLLDALDREVILMRHFEQLSNSEVARALEISEPAAGMRYLRAVRRLRRSLDAAGGGGLGLGWEQRRDA